MAPKRHRYQGTPLAIAEAISSHIVRPGSIQYVENLSSAKLDTALIMKYQTMWVRLKALCSNCSFPQNSMLAAMQIVLEREKGMPQFQHMSEEEDKDWVKTMEARIRCMGRHIQQALCRKSRPTWVKQLFSEVAGAAAAGEASGGDKGEEGKDAEEQQEEEQAGEQEEEGEEEEEEKASDNSEFGDKVQKQEEKEKEKQERARETKTDECFLASRDENRPRSLCMRGGS